jgi:hypothetical protein
MKPSSSDALSHLVLFFLSPSFFFSPSPFLHPSLFPPPFGVDGSGGHTETVKVLLHHGADPRAASKQGLRAYQHVPKGERR